MIERSFLRIQVAWAEQDAVGSILCQPLQELECFLKLLLLVNGKLLGDGCGEPVQSRSPALLYPFQAFGGERHQRLPAVGGVGRATDEAGYLQGRNDSAHGL